ncbi:MAG TPA: alcohol dehydrogenase catalytic domain-containing protein [Terriglobia bacterium]|nr:alcohol dehydrogenase catalytic domain-containing protein [Terriglobia bacterium]
MKALYFDGNLELREVARPRPTHDEALIEVIYAGLCGTDREILKGYSKFRGIPGHEFVGRVAECANPRWPGKRVVGEINVSCGECEFCLWGLGRHCSRRQVMGIVNRDGAFAEYVTLPIVNLHEVPPEISDEEAVFVEPVAAAAEILEQMPLSHVRRIAVLGDGRLGLLVAQVLRQAGGQVTVIGKHASKLAQAKSWKVDVVEAGKAEIPAASFSVVVEATGSPSGLAEALRLVEPRGTVVMKSTFRETATFDTAKLVVDEITLLGSRCGNFKKAIELLRHKKVKVGGLVSKTFPLEQALEAFEYLSDPACLKVLISPQPNDRAAG